MKKTPLICAALLSFTVFAGCADSEVEKPQIDIYTNATCAVEVCYDAAFLHTVEGGRFSLGEKVPCAGLESRRTVKYNIMNTDASLLVAADFTPETESRYEEFCTAVSAVLDGIDASLSITRPTSGISRFNEAEAGASVEIDGIAYEVLTVAKSVYEMTDGFYNPAVYYSVQAYGFNGSGSGDRELPDSESTRKYAELAAHFAEIELKADGDKYYAVKPSATVDVGGETLSLKLDLGGVGKGYATDKVNGLFDEYGFAYGYFDFGQSSMALKKFAGTGEYTLGLINPRASGDFLRLSASDACLSTSGDYQQYFIKDGVRYCHIIDPTTGEPIRSGIMTVTLIGGSAAENDALTTAIACMGVERAKQFVEEKLTDRLVVFSVER